MLPRFFYAHEPCCLLGDPNYYCMPGGVMKTAVGFLWHMHQPYYKDPLTGVYMMPWVRLHAVRGYYDMIAILEDYPEVRCTFNLVPSLIAQILDYTENGARDTDYLLSQKPAKDLSDDDKEQILNRHFMCNRQTMIEPFPRFAQLLEKRGHYSNQAERERALRNFTAQDLLDLQVLFNLSWIGFMARRDKGLLELIKKGQGYSEVDKSYVLEQHLRILRELLPLYKKAQDEGRIEITTTPFYHPIGPLVMNVGYALRCMDIPLPSEPFAHPEDLDLHVRKAIELHSEVFGQPPKGMWPAEGSVCPEMIELIGRHGIRWAATDEDILFASLKQDRTGHRLHRPYKVGEVALFFRDRALADNIGFVYSRNPAESAVNDFMHHLDNIGRGARAHESNPFVSIILDGENPWEYYADGGEGFLRGIYSRLSRHDGVYTARFGDFINDNAVESRITNLFTGSWINHNFAIWIGHEEDRKAWEYLAKTRQYVVSKGDKADPLAWEEIYIAEGSDWCWWYGDEFSNEGIAEFDRLFRLHLKNCYDIHGDAPPDYLSRSIITPHDIVPMKDPAGFVHPLIDGEISHFYEWRRAGVFLTSSGASSMYQTEQVISQVYYGFDAESLMLRLDFFRPIKKRCSVVLELEEPSKMQVVVDVDKQQIKVIDMLAGKTVHRSDDVAYVNILEFKVPFGVLRCELNQRLRFCVALEENGIELERHPASGLLSFNVPDLNFERKMWYV